MAKRIQWILAFITAVGAAVLLYAQNPVSITQVGTTAVGTTVPVSGTVTANAGSGTMAVSGTFWQATQPVSGTFWQATQPVSGTFWQATQPVSFSNQSVNVSQLAGTTTDTNSGSKSAGTLRVVLATDQPALTNKLLVTPDSVALPANQSVNVSQINGVTPLMGAGNTGTGSHRVTVATDQAAFETIPVTTATTTNTATTYFLTSAASTNSTSVKGSAGNLYAIHITNTTTTNYFLRLYNLSTAPTCSSATGYVETIPALGASANGGVNGRTNGVPQAFATGIGFCLTGGGSSTDNTNAATGVYLTLIYK